MYLLNFMAVVTLYVTSTNHPVESSSVFAFEGLPVLIAKAVIKSMGERLKRPQDEMEQILEKYVNQMPEMRVLMDRYEEDVLISKMTSIIEEKISDWELRRVAFHIKHFTGAFFEGIQTYNKRQHSAFSPFTIHASYALAAFTIKKGMGTRFFESFGLELNGTRYGQVAYEEFIDTVNRINSSVLNLKFKYFYNRNLRLKCSFEEKAREIFRTTSEALDFGQTLPHARNTILKWMAKETNTLDVDPEDITQGINSKTSIVIATAGYFKGALETRFRYKSHGIFLKNDDPNDKSYLEFYSGVGVYHYGYEGYTHSKYIVLPLKVEGSSLPLSLVVLHPNKIGGRDEIFKMFYMIQMPVLLRQDPIRVKIYMPKISFHSFVEVTESLKKININMIPGGTPDFRLDGIVEGDVIIDKVYHKTVIDIETETSDEQEPDLDAIEFNVTSSYVYAIFAHKPTPVVLFVGQSA